MHLIIVTFGSGGDVYPFIGIGMAMKARGHRVTLMTSPHFGKAITDSGLEFSALGTEKEYTEAINNPDLWHPRKALKVVMDAVIASLRPATEGIRGLHEASPGETVILAQMLALAAIVAGEAFGIPTITAHLAPVLMRSDRTMPRFPGPRIPDWAPRFARRGAWRLIDWFIDGMIARPINELRTDLGLERGRGFFGGRAHSPLRSLGMWPDWYAEAMPDWPSQFRAVGFPLADAGHLHEPDEALEAFLAAGDKPVAFTPGTAMSHGHRFFRESVAACEQLGVRGLLLTKHTEHLPTPLPDSVHRVAYAPFGELLPRVAALVHHGGIGTTAQAFAAGIPQLAVPMAHDQFDNAHQITRLGVGDSLPASRYRADRAAKRLGHLLGSPDVAAACVDYAERLRQHDSRTAICEAIEEAELVARGVAGIPERS